MDNSILRTSRRQYLTLLGIASAGAIAGCSESEDGDIDNNDSENGGDENQPDDSGDTSDGEDGNTGDGSDGTDGDDEDGSDEDGSDGEDDGETEPEPAASFEVTNIDHPDSVEVETEYTVSVTVENSGDAADDYSEDLEYQLEGDSFWTPIQTVELSDVGAGDSATWESDTIETISPATVRIRVGEQVVEFPAEEASLDTQSFSGSGQEVRQGVTIDGGLTVIEATHQGSSNFQVSLVNDSEFDDIFVNVIGNFDGAQANYIDQGEYILDVNADGEWSVNVVQPRSSSGDSLPQNYSGTGPDVVGPVEFDGSGIANGTHQGSSNFQVEIYEQGGSFQTVVFNEIGEFEGQTTYNANGVAWVDVNADGDWTLDLE